MSIAYGIDVESEVGNRFLNANLEAAHTIAAALVPGKFLVDVIPIRVSMRPNSGLKEPNGPSDSTVHPRLVPWDGVQGSRQRNTP